MIWLDIVCLGLFVRLLRKLTEYRKVPKFSDARKLCCNLPKIQTKRRNLKVYCKNCAIGKANSEDPLGAV